MSKQKVEIDDFAKLKKLGSLTLSPSGRKAAFTVTEGCLEENKYLTDIWVYDETRETPLFRLTAGEDGTAPLFEDEDHILFSGDRKKRHKADVTGTKTVINRISLSGGEAEEAFVLPFTAGNLTKLKEDLWLCSGKRNIALPDFSVMDEAEKEKAKKALEEEKDYEVFVELPFWFNGQGIINKLRTGLFLCDMQAGTQELLTDLHFDLHGFCLNEAHTKLAYWGTRFETINRQKSSLFVRDLTTGEVTEADLQERYSIEDAHFFGEELIFAGSTGEEYGTNESESFYRLLPDGTAAFIHKPDINTGAVGSDIAGGGCRPFKQDGFYYICTNGYRSDYEYIGADGKPEILLNELNIISAAAGSREDLFFIGMEKDRAQELYRKQNGKVEKLSAFNEAYFETHETARTEHFSFTDQDGTEIDGWVLYPADFDQTKKYPGILNVHGGPRSAYGEGFFHEMQYWAGLGYLCFFCNPRGGNGKGDAFADIRGERFGVYDYEDLMQFTDEVLKRVPQLDPDRLAMTGGSYGGFMANWIIGHTDRFKAVASCRSISNYISKCLTTDIGYYHNMAQMKADPWTAPEKMWAHSPLAYANKAVTPTLFIQSDEDYRCWMGDAIQMYQALMLHNVPTRMCLFHGENHELSRSGKPKHRVRRIREITQWFEKYL